MATRKSQRIGILIITVVMVVGTLGSFLVTILMTKENSSNQAKYQSAVKDYNNLYKEYEDKKSVQADELSQLYYDDFVKYEDYAKAFDINSVKDISTEDLLTGGGDVIDDSTRFAAYYIGWDANGRIFDQSVDLSSKKLKIPLYYNDVQSGSAGLIEGLSKASLIEGWKTGMKGMHIGGVRLIAIPSDKAYGQSGQGDIAPNMPLKFIVMAIPAPTPVPNPDFTDALKQMAEAQQQ